MFIVDDISLFCRIIPQAGQDIALSLISFLQFGHLIIAILFFSPKKFILLLNYTRFLENSQPNGTLSTG